MLPSPSAKVLSDLVDSITEIHHEVTDLLGGPPAVRFVVVPRIWTQRLPTSSTKNT
jgi:hypothetical protein